MLKRIKDLFLGILFEIYVRLFGRKLDWYMYPIDGQPILDKLCEWSEVFKNYYEAVRPHLPQTIQWNVDSSLPEEFVCRFEIDGTLSLLFLHDEDIKPEHAPIVAHQLERLRMAKEGFPTTNPYPVLNVIAFGLTALLQEPLANERLMAHGFDIEEIYARRRADFTAKIVEAEAPTNQGELQIWMFNYVPLILYERLFTPSEGFVSVTDMMQENHPRVAKQARHLLRIVDKTGYDTPAKMESAFRQIIHKYNLHQREGIQVLYYGDL